MTKLLAPLLCAAIAALPLAACTKDEPLPAKTPAPQKAEPPAEPAPAEPAPAEPAPAQPPGPEQLPGEAEVAELMKVVGDLDAKIVQLEKEAAEMTERLTAAIAEADAAPDDETRVAARARLERLQRQNAEMQERIAAARAYAARFARLRELRGGKLTEQDAK